jgi:Ion channel.
MFTLFNTARKALLTVFIALKKEEARAVSLILVITLFTGTTFYHVTEKWSLLNSFYFSFTTLTTIGYGDFVPQTVIGKLFTVFYTIVGIGMMAIFIVTVAKTYLEKNLEKKHKINQKHEDKNKQNSNDQQDVDNTLEDIENEIASTNQKPRARKYPNSRPKYYQHPSNNK